MSFLRGCLLLGLIGATVACGSVDQEGFDAGTPVIDAGTPVDSAVPVPDAPAIPRTASAEITAGAGRVSGRVYSVDVQVGHGHAQGPVMGSDTSVEGAAAIKP